MKVFLAGGTGSTGSLLAKLILENGHQLAMVVRSEDGIPVGVRDHPNAHITVGEIADMSVEMLAEQLEGCSAAVSCLGHRPTTAGLFGPPYRLVTNVTRRLCEALSVSVSTPPAKFILMSSSGVALAQDQRSVPIAERLIFRLIQWILPPHADNVAAARLLQQRFGQVPRPVEWVAVRPDGLVDHSEVSNYEVFPSPVRSPLFDAGTTSRINVAHFMLRLLEDDALWQQWQGRAPAVYNTEQSKQTSHI